jgi:thiol-disulfide isomerase/thioredoxin
VFKDIINSQEPVVVKFYAGWCPDCFKELFEIPNPVAASSDGLSLLPYSGEPLTIGGELNKLAANISLDRDTADVHWRSDGIEGMKLG